MDRKAWHSLRWLTLLGAGLAHTGSILASLRADDSRQIEMRTFDVLVEQKPAGEYQLRYEPLDNAITKVTVQAQVKVVILLYTYQYSLRSVELWRQGSLLAYDGAAVDDGTKTNLSAVFAANLPGVTKPRGVTLNGHARPLKENCVWATTYSCLPAPTDSGALPLLDIDTGESRAGKLHWIEAKTVRVGEQPRRCDHFRATGATPTDIWFDDRGRLVQQSFIDNGYATEIRLKTVQSQDPKKPAETMAGVRKRPLK